MTETLLAEEVHLRGHDDDQISAYVARPIGSGSHPTVVVLHHAGGLDDETKEIIRAFGAAGYNAIGPNLHSREEATGLTTEETFGAVIQKGGIPDERCLGDIAAAIEYARSIATSDGKIGLIGYCSGGRQAFLAGGTFAVDAIIDAYGSRHFEAWPAAGPLGTTEVNFDRTGQPGGRAPVDVASELSGPLLALYGGADPLIPPGEFDHLDAVLKEHGKEYTINVYEGATHGFFSIGRSGHIPHTTADVTAALEGWQEVWSFFAEHLR